MGAIRQDVYGATLGEEIRRCVASLGQGDFLARLERRDPLLWVDAPRAEVADRLGWLDLPEASSGEVSRWQALAREVAAEGTSDVLLLGMGGSSLAPEVFQAVFGRAPGRPAVRVLDSTHPHAVRGAAERFPPGSTLCVVSSKSGTTIETTSLFRFFWAEASKVSGEPGRRFVAITDPGTPLERLASERRFRATFLAPKDVGGRFSALSAFGLVPASLAGADVGPWLERARGERRATGSAADGPPSALVLGAVLAAGARGGRDKLTFVASPALASLPGWIEQLVAESLGKDGKGVVPVAGEALTVPSAYRNDRLFVELALVSEPDGAREERLREIERTGHPTVRILLPDRESVAAEMYRWEVAVAAAASVLRVPPFDQPDVQRAKALAERAMAGAGDPTGEDRPVSAWDERGVREALAGWLGSSKAGDYVAVLAFLAPDPATDRALGDLRHWFRDWRGLATTVGYGPRFLHSSGQLHKGGPASGLFLQLVDEIEGDVPIPETPHGFRSLVSAQARGDAEALRERQRRLLRVDVGRDVPAGIARVLAALR